MGVTYYVDGRVQHLPTTSDDRVEALERQVAGLELLVAALARKVAVREQEPEVLRCVLCEGAGKDPQDRRKRCPLCNGREG